MSLCIPNMNCRLLVWNLHPFVVALIPNPALRYAHHVFGILQSLTFRRRRRATGYCKGCRSSATSSVQHDDGQLFERCRGEYASGVLHTNTEVSGLRTGYPKQLLLLLCSDWFVTEVWTRCKGSKLGAWVLFGVYPCGDRYGDSTVVSKE